MKIVFCWSNISGYMAACWRALSQTPECHVHVIAYQQSQETKFDSELMRGVSWSGLSPAQQSDARHILKLVVEQRPDVVVLAGWLNRAYRQLVQAPELRNTRFVMGMDTPWRGGVRQRLGAWVLRPYFQKIEHVLVPGERAWQYARRLGFAGDCISKGLYGVDHAGLSELYRRRIEGPWPRSWLFLGRMHEQKGVDVLLEAYRQYRAEREDAWPLKMAGIGPLANLAETVEGVEYLGFQQPERCRELMQNAGAFILPSRYDPWPLALVEACAAGLPVVATNACGSAVEVLRSGFNGWLGDVTEESLKQMLCAAHDSYESLALMGGRGVLLAEPYAATEWAGRVWEICRFVADT